MSLDPKALASLFEMSRDAVMGIENERVLFLNPAATALLGARPGDPAADHVPNYILTDPAEQFIASVCIGERQGYASVTRKGEFSLISFVLSHKDEPGSLLSRSARELSDALTTARLAMDILIKNTGAEEDEKLRNYAAILYQNFYRMKRLCQHINTADALKKGRLPFRPRVVAIDRMCRDLCDSVKHLCLSMGVQLAFDAQKGRYYTVADQSLLETMLLNLMTNSIAHATKDSRIRLHLSLRGNRILIGLDDEGSGISSNTLSQIMTGTLQPDTTDTAANTGLGLLISKGIAELHGGALILESREGTGTKLRISLPIRLPEETEVHSPPVPYSNTGMDSILTELSVILDKKYYNKTMFD